jgi:hypothetical protein
MKSSLLRETAFRNYFSTADSRQQEAIIERARAMIVETFHEVTRDKHLGFEPADFADVRLIAEFLVWTDAHDGFALYYLGEVERLLGHRDLMREYFHAYLNTAPAPGTALPGRRGPGYFDERSAWVNHLLANDFLCEALETNNAGQHTELVAIIDYHVQEVRRFSAPSKKRDLWFGKGVTTLSTASLESAVNAHLDGVQNSKCPQMK